MAGPAAAQVSAFHFKPPLQDLGWEHFVQGKNTGVRGYGANLEEAFEQAALALAAAVTKAPVDPKIAVTVVCEAPDDELLLAEWLDAVLYEMAARRMNFGRFSVTIRGRRLYGTAWGEPVRARRDGAREPRVNLTEPRITRDPTETWAASCVVDM
ncbi:MAG: archease [Xanthobacteraceae bacterium]